VSDIRVVRSSGVYAFDVEAQGAIESAGQARAFGTLPRGFPDDVLPVTISFTPSLFR
jgi:outer membrane biosynthesis protein TonB